ncbi:MAG: hypothetical protein LCH85_14520 [Chloroflexi bacterium]|nr:hypothetical protein [Chloroflexota bacterium]
MPDQDHNQAINRRQFLKLGAMSGLLASMPELAAANEGSPIRLREPEVMQVGVILPTELHSHRATLAFLAGLQFASEQAAVPFRFNLQTPQSLSHLFTAKAATADIWLSLGTAFGIQTLSDCLPNQAIIAATLGEHFAVANPSPNLLINSFGLADAAWQSAVWASQQRGKRAVIIRSTALSGYDCTWGFAQGLLVAGAELIGDFNFDSADLAAKVASLNPDVVYLALNAAESQQWWHSYTASSKTLWITPNATLDAKLAQRLRKQGLDIAYAGGWSVASNPSFQQAFSKVSGTETTHHHALGYDTALLIASARAGQKTIRYDGLRGATSINAYRTSHAPTYLHFLVSQQRQAAPISLAALDQSSVQQRLDSTRSGVIQPYFE